MSPGFFVTSPTTPTMRQVSLPDLMWRPNDVCLAHEFAGKRFIHNRYTLAAAGIII